MKAYPQLSCIAIFLAATLTAQATHANWVTVAGGGEYSVPTNTFIGKRFEGVIKQQYDFSCGSAALATLLTYYYNRPVSELSVLRTMYENGDKEKITKEGFSLLDMKKYLGAIGYQADGFRDSLDKLKRVDIPAIALINTKGYLHFVVVAGVKGDSVILLDSAKGKRVLSRHDFEKSWNNVLFVIRDDIKTAGKYFNNEKKWAQHRQARFQTSLNAADLASISLSTAYTPGYY